MAFMKERRQRPSRYFPWMFFYLALAGPALGWLGRWFWFFDLFSHFRVQQVGFLILSLPFLIWWKKNILVVLSVFIILIAGFPLLAYCPGLAPSSEEPPVAHPFRVTYANVNVANLNYDAIVSVLLKDKPDVLVISEISASLHEAMTPYLKEYLFQKVVPRSDCFGLGVFSRVPVKFMDVRFLGEPRLPSIRCVIALGAKECVIWATHPTPPMGKKVWGWRNEQLKILLQEIEADPRPRIVVGDLNMAPWCSWFGMFQTAAGLKDSSQGKGIVPTWPFYLPALLRIPLDHILVSEDFFVIQRDVFSLPGSDHRPLSVVLEI